MPTVQAKRNPNSAAPPRPVFEAFIHKKSGKCHRYIPYEILPRYRSGPSARSLASPLPVATTTLASTHAVEREARRNPPRNANASLTSTNVHKAAVTATPAIPTPTNTPTSEQCPCAPRRGRTGRIAAIRTSVGPKREPDRECGPHEQRLRPGIRPVVDAVLIRSREEESHCSGRCQSPDDADNQKQAKCKPCVQDH